MTTNGNSPAALRRIVAVAVVALVTATLQLAFAGSAQAAVAARATTSYIGGGTTVNVRTSPYISNNVAYTVSNGASIYISCQLVGGRLGFSQYADNRTWNKLTNGRYIHDAVTNTPADQGRIYLSDGGYVRFSSTIPRCGSTTAPTRQQQAANQALSTVGKVWAQDTGMAHFFSASDWYPGPYGEWSYDCAKLVRASYLKLGYSPRSAGTAYGLWQAYGSPRRTDTPPTGAFIFWPNLNHVAISVGGGRYVTTMGNRDGAHAPNALRTIGDGAYGMPTGWAMP